MKQKLLNIIYKFLKYCAKKYIEKHKPRVIGITGSVGKTSSRMIITQVLQQLLPEQRISTSPKNFNSELGIVFSIFEITDYTPSVQSLFKNTAKIIQKVLFGKEPYDMIVLEYGLDKPGDIAYLTSIVEPDFGIFTKLDMVHGEFFSDKEAIGREKRILLEKTKHKIYLGAGDLYLEKIFPELHGEKQFFPHVENIKFEKKGEIIHSLFEFGGKQINSNLFGKENLEYVALACQIFLDMGNDLHRDIYHFQLINQPGRFQLFSGIGESMLIDSTYNAAPASMKKMIENTFLLQKGIFSDYKVGLIIGDMRELGETSAGYHLGLNDDVIHADLVYCIGNEIDPLYQALEIQQFGGILKKFTNSQNAGQELKTYLESTDDKYLLLFKGSQNTIFTEEALKEVLKNPEDKKTLVRQTTDWLEKKEKFFEKSEQK
ncbi:MAG: hypothetical protein GY828_05285 [Candidatus Gracilibacteria bacterium]|nr:hypothetical protein [Candidatus Gracilibacteria bacterium]